MPNIEDIGIPYPPDRQGLVTTYGPSTQTGAGEREMFDHSNVWVPACAWSNKPNTACTVLSQPLSGNAAFMSTRVFPDTNGQIITMYTLRRPRLWRGSGNIKGKIWYTGVGDSGKTIYFLMECVAPRESDTSYTALSNSIGATATAPPADWELMQNAFSDSTIALMISSAPSTPDLLGFLLTRDSSQAADNYPHDVHLYGVELMFIPTDTTTDGVSPWLAR